MSDLSVFRKYSYFEKNTKVDGILKEKIPQEFLVGICNSNVGNYSFEGPTEQGAVGQSPTTTTILEGQSTPF